MAILLEATTVDGHTIWHSGNLEIGEYAPLVHEHGDQYIFAIDAPVEGKFLTSSIDGIVESSIYDFESFAPAVHEHDDLYIKHGFNIIEPELGENVYATERADILKFKSATLGESNIEITSEPSSNTIFFKSKHPTVNAATSSNNTSSFIQNVELDEFGHIVNIMSSNVSDLVGGFTVNNFNGLPMVSEIDSTHSKKVLGINSDATSWTFYNSLPLLSPGTNDSYKKVIVNEASDGYVLSEYDVYGNIFLEIDESGNIMPQKIGSEIGEILNPILHGLDPVADRGKILRVNYEGTGFDLQDAVGVGDSHFMINSNSDITPLPFGAEFAYITPPPIQAGDFGKVLRVKEDETGYEISSLFPNITLEDENSLVTVDNTTNSLKFVKFATNSETEEGLITNQPISPSSLKSWPFSGQITVTVGFNKDFLTINEAINYLTSRPRLNNTNANIVIDSGFVVTEQIIADKSDLSWITISSSAEIEVSRMHLTYGYQSASILPLFSATNNGKLPIINALFMMNESGTDVGKCGIYCDNNSTCTINKNCGIKNVSHIAVAAYNNSTVQMEEAIFTDSKGMGVFCNSSRIIMNRANVSNASLFGIRSWNGGFIVAAEADCRRTAGVDTSEDITIGSGSLILCANSIGGTNHVPNVVTSHGVIIK